MARPSLDDQDFAAVIRHAPLISIDLIIRDPEGKVLVGLRANEPAKGLYFVPGGAILKNERLDDAFLRIIEVETGICATRVEAKFLGVFEHFYATNRFGDPTYGTHYVVIAYELALNQRPEIKLDSQHADFRWLHESELIAAADVHANTKAYFSQPRS